MERATAESDLVAAVFELAEHPAARLEGRG